MFTLHLYSQWDIVITECGPSMETVVPRCCHSILPIQTCSVWPKATYVRPLCCPQGLEGEPSFNLKLFLFQSYFDWHDSIMENSKGPSIQTKKGGTSCQDAQSSFQEDQPTIQVDQNPPPVTQGIEKKPRVLETDPVILARREKQILYGKSTADYAAYLKTVPKNERTSQMPRTPNVYKVLNRLVINQSIKLRLMRAEC